MEVRTQRERVAFRTSPGGSEDCRGTKPESKGSAGGDSGGRDSGEEEKKAGI